MTLPNDNPIGSAMHARLSELYPICRSITGNGLRQTLALLKKTIPLTVYEVPSGTQVFDWTVPNEWSIRDAWIKNSKGERIVDFQKHNLHILHYSTPIRATMSLAELKTHLVSLPDQPDDIPYRTSYYKEDWGFCIQHNALLEMQEDQYEVCIDSSLAPGSLSYGELFLPGDTNDEVLFSAHVCHPSLANDNLSGVVVAAELAAMLATERRRYSYRFLFIPGTIGAITWLARNEATTKRIKHGLVLSGLGDPGSITYKRSRQSTAGIDRTVMSVLANSGVPYAVQDFSPYGYDERQFCSPGFNLPVGCFSRTPYGTYPQYHTSSDNPDFVKPAALADSLQMLLKIVAALESNELYVNTHPKCEPQLGKRGLYKELTSSGETMAMLWVLNLADGQNSLHDIAERSMLPLDSIRSVAAKLAMHGLLSRVHEQ